MTDHYDVIIIGSGAGGGTLAHTLAESGKQILLLERGDYLPREMDNWDPASGVHRRASTSRRTPGTTPTASRSSPRSTTSSAGPPSSTAPRCTGCGPQDFGELHHVDGLSPAWPLTYDDFEPWYTRPSGSTRCTATAARTRPRATARKPYPWPAVSHEPRIQQLFDDLADGRLPPVPRARAASCSTRPTGPRAPASAAPGATATPAWCTPRPTPRPSPCARSSTCPNVTLLVDAEVTRARDRRQRPHGHRRGRARGRRRRRPTSGDIVVVVRRRLELGQAAAALGQRPPPERAGQRLRTRSAGTTCSTTARPSSRSPKEPNDTVYQKTLGINDFYLGGAGLRLPARQHPDGRQVQRRGHEGRGAPPHQAGPALDAGRGGPPRRRLLADHRGPAPGRQPGHARRRRQRAPRLPLDQRRRRPTGCTTS